MFPEGERKVRNRCEYRTYKGEGGRAESDREFRRYNGENGNFQEGW